MTEIFENLHTVIKATNEKVMSTDNFKRLLAEVCVSNELKCKEYRKLMRVCSPVQYDEDEAENYFDAAKESEPCTTLHDLEKYIKTYKNEDDLVEFEKDAVHASKIYLSYKEHFEGKLGWCKINKPAVYGRVFRTNLGITFDKEENSKMYFENKNFKFSSTDDDGNTKAKTFNFYNVWVRDPDIKTYESIVFDPTRSNPNDLNLFDSYCSILQDSSVEYVELDRVFEHIKSICGYDTACFEYLLNYFAHIVQKPASHSDVAVVMFGKEGVGKNILLGLLGDVIGSQYYGESSEPRDLFGQFATGMFRRIVFCYDEGDKKDTAPFMNRLKTLVTGQKLRVELKGKDMYEVANYCRLFFPTNHSQPFPITKGARRWFYLKASDKYINIPNRHAHFDSLANHFKDKNVIFSFCKYLMNRDIKKFNVNSFPKSEGLQQATQIPLILRCFHSTILSSTAKASKIYPATELLHIVIKYCKDHNYTHSAYNPTTLGAELQEYIDAKCIVKKRSRTGIMYKFDSLGFQQYIQQNNFNLEELDLGSDLSVAEKLLQQIEEHRKILADLEQKFLLECSVVMGFDPLDEGVDKTDYSIHNPAPQKKEKYTKRLSFKTEMEDTSKTAPSPQKTVLDTLKDEFKFTLDFE